VGVRLGLRRRQVPGLERSTRRLHRGAEVVRAGEPRDAHLAVLVVAVIVLGAIISTCSKPARAQGGHAEGHDWYQHLKTRSGWSCCNAETADGNGDCRPVQARARDDGQWEAYYGGGWQIVPAEAILADSLNHEPFRAHICERAGFVYCFLRGGAGG
jgi:hypothetical protein